MISAAQCRSARTLLGWSVSKLSGAASVSESAIDDLELERRQPSATTIDAIQRALRMSGCCFSPKTTFNYGATCQRRGDDCRSDCQQRIGASPIHIRGPGDEDR
jgi:transcriptional regulator with XRE-family HTH domain